MLLSKAIKYRIEKLLKENDMTSYSLAMSAGIPPSTLNDFFRGKVALPRLDNILHICEALNMDLKEFFDDPVFDDVESDNK